MDAQNHIQEMETRLNTSKYAVTKVESLIQYLSDQDKDFVIGRLQAAKGQPQSIRIPPKRNRKGSQESA